MTNIEVPYVRSLTIHWNNLEMVYCLKNDSFVNIPYIWDSYAAVTSWACTWTSTPGFCSNAAPVVYRYIKIFVKEDKMNI